MDAHNLDASSPPPSPRWVRAAIWLPGLVVALGAAVATAHGLYEVAVAARVPTAVAWLYPLITDGLALVAYAATARLASSARRYAWTVVVLAAGLSGLAQASFLAGGVEQTAPALRFGVGAWPAVAAAVVAHLLYLFAADDPAVRPPAAVEPIPPSAQPEPAPVQAASPLVRPSDAPSVHTPDRPSESPARDRARDVAERHAAEHGELPTVSALMTLAQVSRGTAGDALKSLRNRPAALHLISTDQYTRTAMTEHQNENRQPQPRTTSKSKSSTHLRIPIRWPCAPPAAAVGRTPC